jgi:hypothetical protein
VVLRNRGVLIDLTQIVVERVIVEIDPRAKVTVSVEGHGGPGCRDVSRAIEAALGRTTDDERTPDFYQEEGTHARNAHHHG